MSTKNKQSIELNEAAESCTIEGESPVVESLIKAMVLSWLFKSIKQPNRIPNF